MLHFNKIYNSTTRLNPWRFIPFASLSSSVASEPNIAEQQKSNGKDVNKRMRDILSPSLTDPVMNKTNVNQHEVNRTAESNLNAKILSAKSIDELLNLVKTPELSNKNALNIMSSITNFINSGKVQFSDIQRDSRFMELQKISNVSRYSLKVKENIYSNLSTSRLIEVMVAFSRDKNRDIPKLKLLTLNILEYNDTLTVRQCSSLLYCMVNLSFHNKMLLNKIATDLLYHLPNYKNFVVISYIVFSLGLLRYKHTELLDQISKWTLTYDGPIVQKDIIIFLCTFAALGYTGENTDLFIEKYVKLDDEHDWICKDDLIDFSWALTVLGHTNNELLDTVLNKDVIEQDLTVPKQIKLLNLNGAARYIASAYSGSYIPEDSPIFNIQIKIRDGKQKVIKAAVTALEAMFKDLCVKSSVNTKMGFLIDIECFFDSDWKPLPSHWITSENNNTLKRVAMFIRDYYDYCKGNEDIVGPVAFQKKLLEAKGYTILDIPAEDIDPTDKVEKHIKYLQKYFVTLKR